MAVGSQGNQKMQPGLQPLRMFLPANQMWSKGSQLEKEAGNKGSHDPGNENRVT